MRRGFNGFGYHIYNKTNYEFYTDEGAIIIPGATAVLPKKFWKVDTEVVVSKKIKWIDIINSKGDLIEGMSVHIDGKMICLFNDGKYLLSIGSDIFISTTYEPRYYGYPNRERDREVGEPTFIINGKKYIISKECEHLKINEKLYDVKYEDHIFTFTPAPDTPAISDISLGDTKPVFDLTLTPGK